MLLGGVYIIGGLAHFYLLWTSPAIYDEFANQALVGTYTDLWRAYVVPNLAFLVPIVGLFELAVGGGLLWRGRAVQFGHTAGAVFQAGLVLSGPWGPINAAITFLHVASARHRYPVSVLTRLLRGSAS